MQFEVVTAKLEKGDICFNKRNGNREKNEYFEQGPYNPCYAVEGANGWMDRCCSLLNRFDTIDEIRKRFNYLVFIAIALKKVKKKNK